MAEGWQPIVTAPLDGSEVDLWVVYDTGEGRRVPNAHWGVGRIPFEGREIRGWIAKSEGVDGSEGALDPDEEWPTHWRSLPDPPEVKAELNLGHSISARPKIEP